MKLTHELDFFIKIYNVIYCQILGIPNDHILIIGKEALKQSAKLFGIKKMNSKFGYFHKTKNIIFINVDLIPNRKKLKYVLAHELTHKKFPNDRHGVKFEKKIYDLMN
jgi:predicted metal-dependent hydrolase